VVTLPGLLLFSSLTENTTISGPEEMASYAVFFALTWQLWAAQAAYDVKFYTHDWCHRIFFLFHLLLYGCLAAFTSDFDSERSLMTLRTASLNLS